MTLIDLLFPKECLGCKRPGSYICSSCINKLSSIKLLCPECQKPAVDGITHVRCKKKLGMDALLFKDFPGLLKDFKARGIVGSSS